jgi:hypothetical protein
MKSDSFKLDGTLPATEVALDKVEMLAEYFGFDPKDVAFCRLLAEEAINSFASLLGINTGTLWVETTEKDFEVHLKTNAQLSTDKREELIDLSKSKKNTAKKGIIGKISRLVDYIATDMVVGENPFIFSNMADEMLSYSAIMASPDIIYWSLQKDKAKLEQKDEGSDIERSIIERFADDIVVSIALKNIEIVIKKTKK